MSDSLAEALANLQNDLPYVPKDTKAQYGNYADLATLTRIVMPRLADLGLVWVCYTERDGDKVDFHYRLYHIANRRSTRPEGLAVGLPAGLVVQHPLTEWDADEASKPDPMRAAMGAMFALYKELGVTEKDPMLFDIGEILDHPVESRADLTLEEVKAVNGVLRKRRDAARKAGSVTHA